ncbi:MAG TPA: CAP domain-containing protein [Anaerolineaceae bacterium]|nr:CAP domain-containing protein [Anaerolineaceae bacterium]
MPFNRYLDNQKILSLKAAALLGIFVLIALTAAQPAPQPELAPPPVAPQPAEQVSSGLTSQAQAPDVALATGNNRVFLPVIQTSSNIPITNSSSRQDAVALYEQEYIGSNQINPGWNGNIANCTPGNTSSAFRDVVLRRINYFRVMAGIPRISGLSALYNQQDQAAALTMAANHDLNHSPPANWKCVSSDSTAGAGNSNLALGGYGSNAINMYMDDGGVASLGHRRWVLYPQTQTMGTGDIPGDGSGWQTISNALRVFDDHMWDARPATSFAFVAWPPPGYVPYPVVYATWSFAVAGADFSSASVSVTVGGSPVSLASFNILQSGFGENAISWTLKDVSFGAGADKVCQVAVRGVKVGEQSKNYAYTVTVIDPSR